MDAIKYIKSFNKGQITIPKEFREKFGIKNEFWLKIYVDENKIIAEPMEQKNNISDMKKNLLSIKGDWLDEEELKKNRSEIEKRLLQNAL